MHILAPYMSCVVNMPLSPEEPNELEQAIAEGYAQIYVVTADGIIKHHKLRGNNRYIRVKVDKIPGWEAPKLTQTINFLPAGKIPKHLFDQILSFFYNVIKHRGGNALEAMAWICWNQEQGYHIIIPTQQVGGASVTYDWAAVPAGTSIIVDIHSHNYMNAFFSGTDNRDDGANISFSGVVGKMDQPQIQTVWRFNYQDRKFEAKFEDIFDVTPADVPDDWLEKVKTYTPARSVDLSNGRGRADHLKQWQFKKSAPVEDGPVNGNRVGPHMRARGGWKDDVVEDPGPYNGRVPLDFGGEFWGMGEGIDLLGGHGDERASRAERALVDVNEDPLGDSRLGKLVGEAGKSNGRAKERTLAVDAASPELADDGVPGEDSSWNGHERFDELSINHGVAVAESFCVIDDFMSSLSGKDELLQELIGDMFELSSDEGQAEIFRSLYDRLPSKVQEKLATNGF